ncbi:MAG TPA: hypothetical protein PLX97_05840 [Gemmatales bacterium]|nr:hypothetical protein [Gemmatales bacterium]
MMNQTFIIRGRYSKQAFIPSEPMPIADGSAELRIVPDQNTVPTSIFNIIGKADKLRTAEDIAKQLHEERNSWGDS